MKQAATTRDCTDPWTTVFVKVNGDVAPCCWARPIGNLKQNTMEEIVAGELALTLRKQVLSGALPTDCVQCPARGTIETGALAAKVRALARTATDEPEFALRRDIRRAEQEIAMLDRQLAACDRTTDAARAAELESRLRTTRKSLAELTYSIRKPWRARLRKRIARALRRS